MPVSAPIPTIRDVVRDVLSCACSQTARERERLIALLEAREARVRAQEAVEQFRDASLSLGLTEVRLTWRKPE